MTPAIRHITIIMLSASLAALSGCAPGESATKNTIRRNLKDPDSAKFEDFRTVQNGKIGCIRVNAKNSYGAYGGYSTIAVEDLDTSYPKEIDEHDTKIYELCSSGSDSDNAYASLQCSKVLRSIRLWRESIDAKQSTDAKKAQYVEWLRHDMSEAPKYCSPDVVAALKAGSKPSYKESQ